MRQRYPEQRWIKNWLIDHNMKQKELGRKLGIEESYFSRIVNGDRPIELELAGRMAKVMDVSLEEVLAQAREKPSPAARDLPEGQESAMEVLEQAVARAREELEPQGYEVTVEIKRVLK